MKLFRAAVESYSSTVLFVGGSVSTFLYKSKRKGCAREVMSSSINGGDVTVSGYMKYTLPGCCCYLPTIDIYKR